MPKLTIQIQCRISPTRDDAGFVLRTIERTIRTMEAAGIAVDSTNMFLPAQIDYHDGDDALELED